jgi:hypothetical protein
LENLESNGKNTGINVNIKKLGRIFVNWIVMATNRDQWREIKNFIMKHMTQ